MKESRVFAGERPRPGFELQIVQIGFQRNSRVVVIDFSRMDRAVLHVEIKNCIRDTLVTRLPRRRQVASALRVDFHAQHRLVENEFTELDLAMKERKKSHTDVEALGLKKRELMRDGIFGAVNHNGIRLQAQAAPVHL